MNSQGKPLSAVPDRAGTLRASVRAEWPLAAFCLCVAAAALLYNIFNSPDILYDEAAYTWASQQVALGWHLTLSNQPLFVHPPLTFLLQAAWLHLTGYSSAALPSAIHAARLLAASPHSRCSARRAHGLPARRQRVATAAPDRDRHGGARRRAQPGPCPL